MSAKTLLTLGACAATSLVLFGLKRILAPWTKAQLDFDFPVEKSTTGLFV